MSYYNGCGAAFFICNALDCNNGDLITARHNELCDEAADLAGNAFTPTHVCENPKFLTGHAVCGGKGKYNDKGVPPKDKGELKGNLLIRYLWTEGTDSIHGMRVLNNEAVSY